MKQQLDHAVILTIPMLSNPRLNNDSNYVYLRELIPAILEERPNWQFLMVWPTGTHWKFYDDGFFTKYSKSVFRIPKTFQESKYRAGIDFDVSFYHKLLHEKPAHLIWNNVPELTPLFPTLKVQESPEFRPIVVNFHHWVLHKSLPAFPKTHWYCQGMQANSFPMADFNIWNSEYTRKLAFDIASQWLSKERINEIRSETFLMGSIGKEFPEVQSYEKPRAIYNHRLAVYKNPEATFALFKQIHSENKDFRVSIALVDESGHTDFSCLPFVETRYFHTKAQYYEELSMTNINCSHSDYETFCISMSESMGAGHAVMGKNQVTFPELFDGGKAGYLFNNDREALDHLRALVGSKELRQEWGEKAKARARQEFSNSNYAKKVVDLFEKQYFERHTIGFSAKSEQIKKSIAAIPKNTKLKDAWRFVQQELGWANQSLPVIKFIALLNQHGRSYKIIRGEPYVA